MYFQKVAGGLDMGPLQAQLAANPHLWDQFNVRRTAPGSPHAAMTDIWVRYNDPRPFLAKGSWDGFNEEHHSVWYPSAALLPALRPLVFGLMAHVQGEELGGVLLTRLPPGEAIKRHTDAGWHAKHYEKHYVAINAPPGAHFCWDTGVIAPDVGDIWWFRNDVPHWVENHSNEDRLAAIVCIRTDQFRGHYEPL